MKALFSVQVAFLLLIGNYSGAAAQFANGTEPVCYNVQQAFSIGSTLRSDAELLECVRTENGAIWKLAEDLRPMSCMHNNTYYSPGALLETKSENQTMACQSNGTWQAMTDAKE